MKYILLLLLVLCESAFSCTLAPEKITVNEDMGFVFESEKSDLCETCSQIRIVAPAEFKSKNNRKESYSHSVFTFYVDNRPVTKTVSWKKPESEMAEFIAILAMQNNWKYEVSFLYGGPGQCMTYELVYAEEK